MGIGKSEQDLAFVRKWSRVQKRGKIFYIVTRGIGIGSLMFLISLSFTLYETYHNEAWQTIYFYSHRDYFIKKCLTDLLILSGYGGIFASMLWKHKEEKMHYLS